MMEHFVKVSHVEHSNGVVCAMCSCVNLCVYIKLQTKQIFGLMTYIFCFADGFCTTVTARSLMCNYAIPDYPICTTYCNEGHVSTEGTLV